MSKMWGNEWIKSWTTDAQWDLFSLKSQTFGLGQTNSANKFWGIWYIFGQTISIHFGTVSCLSMFSIIKPLFLKKTNVLSFYPPKSCFRILIKFLESKFSFSADFSHFYVMIYNSKNCIRILNTDLDSKLKLKC